MDCRLCNWYLCVDCCPPPIERDIPISAETAERRAQLELGFKLPDGTLRQIIFYKTPLGLDVTKTRPVQIKNVMAGGAGAEEGIQAGWQLSSVNGEDVTDT